MARIAAWELESTVIFWNLELSVLCVIGLEYILESGIICMMYHWIGIFMPHFGLYLPYKVCDTRPLITSTVSPLP